MDLLASSILNNFLGCCGVAAERIGGLIGKGRVIERMARKFVPGVSDPPDQYRIGARKIADYKESAAYGGLVQIIEQL